MLPTDSEGMTVETYFRQKCTRKYPCCRCFYED